MSIARQFARSGAEPGLRNAFFRDLTRDWPVGTVAELYVTDADGRTSLEPISAERADAMIAQLASLKLTAAARDRHARHQAGGEGGP